MVTSVNAFPSSSVYCHRGYWLEKNEQNTFEAFIRAQKLGFSIETDVRDSDQKIGIAHDPIFLPEEMVFEDYLELRIKTAINIKSDGLANLLLPNKKVFLETGSFFFDGSIPQMLLYRNLELPHALRLSEYETEIPWITNYIWLDAFHSDWWLKDNVLERFRDQEIEIVIVSPEIHGRNPKHAWEEIHRKFSEGYRNISICTDLPTDFLDHDMK
jgi:hypothetical protein